MSRAELLILDEPTKPSGQRHGGDWLEDYLKNFRGALLMRLPTDRYFRDSVVKQDCGTDQGRSLRLSGGYEGRPEAEAMERLEMAEARSQALGSILRREIA